MYRAQSMRRHLESEDFQDFLQSIERYTSIWFSEKNLIGTSVYMESQNGIQESFDIQLEKELYNIGGTRFDSSEVFE